MAKKNYSDLEKLQVLLTHWLQHNESHGSEYLKWAEVARQDGLETAADLIEEAVAFLKKSDESLKKAQESVGSPAHGHQGHHHHHD
jgi:hypothetical protein